MHDPIYSLCPVHPISHLPLFHRMFRNGTILMVHRVAVAVADGVAVVAAVLAVVGVVWLAPLLGVEGAVGTFRDVVLAQEVNVEVFARDVATIRIRVAAVVASSSVTSNCAFVRIIDTREVADAYVGILSFGILRSVNGTTVPDRSVISWDGIRWVVLGVAIGA